MWYVFVLCIRRERNRIHAKRTRFRKRMRLELNEHLAREMQVENRALVKYLFRFDLITDEKIRHYEAMDETFRSEVAQLQVCVVLLDMISVKIIVYKSCYIQNMLFRNMLETMIKMGMQ